ncbi:MAG: cupin domain-containing protein [Desulfovibrionaceae bacterium]|nr:cupin domain-containing protein [Desulfovibrionaceae bacterium]MBF0512981.1 cupin domain-containing protein [Desulfovibrionaceae bacterium]
MDSTIFKNIAPAVAHDLTAMVEYLPGQVVSKTLVQNKALSLTLFAFPAGEGLSEHTARGEALVQVLDGEALLTIGGKKVRATAGQTVVMPAGTPHALDAPKAFKMLLCVVQPEA